MVCNKDLPEETGITTDEEDYVKRGKHPVGTLELVETERHGTLTRRLPPTQAGHAPREVRQTVTTSFTFRPTSHREPDKPYEVS